MLHELYLLQQYYGTPQAAIPEDDLVARYGRDPVSKAIHDGLIEHRRIPCASGRRRCVCWLSDKGTDALFGA